MLHPYKGQKFRLKKDFSGFGTGRAKEGAEGCVTDVWKTGDTWWFNWIANGMVEKEKEWVASNKLEDLGHFPKSSMFDWIYGDKSQGKTWDWHKAGNKTRDKIFRHLFRSSE